MGCGSASSVNDEPRVKKEEEEKKDEEKSKNNIYNKI